MTETAELPDELLIPEGEPIPWAYTPAGSAFEIPNIPIDKVREWKREIIDVSCGNDMLTQHVPGRVTLLFHDGSSYEAGSEVVRRALAGGGTFVRAYLNSPYWVQTEAEYEAQLDAEAEAAAYDYDW